MAVKRKTTRTRAVAPTPEGVPTATLAGWLLNRPLMLSRRCADALAAAITGAADGVVPQALFGLEEDEDAPDRDMVVRDGVAIIPVRGVLVHRSMGWLDRLLGLTSYEGLARQVAQATADDAVRALLFDVDSPGGEVGGLFDLVDQIAAVAKPKAAIANESAFSAAYAIAAAAGPITLSRTAGVGSVGVIAQHVSWAEWERKVGIAVTAIFAGDRKNDGSPHEPLSAAAAETIRAEVFRLYDLFVAHVATHRRMTPDAVRATEAGDFFGGDAVAAQLADEVGTFDLALERVAARARSPQLVRAGGATMADVSTGNSEPGSGVTMPKAKSDDAPKTDAAASAAAVPVAEPAAAPAAEPATVTTVEAVREALDQRRAWEADVVNRCLAVHRPDLAATLILENVSADALGERITDAVARSAAADVVGSHATEGGGSSVSPLVANAKKRAESAKKGARA